TEENGATNLDHWRTARDPGPAIVGPAGADIFWGAGDRAGQLASHVHHAGNFAMLVPRELDPTAAAARMPLPPQKPIAPAEAKTRTPSARSPALQSHSTQRHSLDGLQDAPKRRGVWTTRNR